MIYILEYKFSENLCKIVLFYYLGWDGWGIWHTWVTRRCIYNLGRKSWRKEIVLGDLDLEWTKYLRQRISIVKPTRCTNVSNYFILEWHYTFRTVFPSIIRSSRLYIKQQAFVKHVQLGPASKQTAVPVWHMSVAVCSVLKSWWWTERPSQTRRVSFQNKIIWYIGASGWFYYRNILRCTALWMSKMPRPARSSLSDHWNSIWWGVQTWSIHYACRKL